MKLKTVLTFVLLAFVAVSAAWMIIKETGSRDAAAGNIKQQEADNPALKGHTVAAYYFHGDARCPTCIKIESYTGEAITGTFTNELSSGCLSWQVLNTDEPEHEHFVKDFELTTKSVVLVEKVDGKQVNWKNLDRIWDLVDDKDVFKKYIIEETKDCLAKGSM